MPKFSVMKTLPYIIGFIAVAVAVVALNSFIIMILWGAIASAFDASTIGYGTAVLISLALGVVGNFLRGVK